MSEDVFSCRCLSLSASTPAIDLFASPDTAQLRLYLTYSQRTLAGKPNALMEDWSHWKYVYIFQPLVILVLLKVMRALR
ncbi:hypothetical protein E2C01_041840 [Portunus trituberculatus]|uniref:Uncharacterized protein n=1 Tax=Portunus trituberculatus TaxID=210409 RepID=A0A5B7FRR4_PORTR|nr:hypothetical protein [Portunus trituberculatus]